MQHASGPRLRSSLIKATADDRIDWLFGIDSCLDRSWLVNLASQDISEMSCRPSRLMTCIKCSGASIPRFCAFPPVAIPWHSFALAQYQMLRITPACTTSSSPILKLRQDIGRGRYMLDIFNCTASFTMGLRLLHSQADAAPRVPGNGTYQSRIFRVSRLVATRRWLMYLRGRGRPLRSV